MLDLSVQRCRCSGLQAYERHCCRSSCKQVLLALVPHLTTEIVCGNIAQIPTSAGACGKSCPAPDERGSGGGRWSALHPAALRHQAGQPQPLSALVLGHPQHQDRLPTTACPCTTAASSRAALGASMSRLVSGCCPRVVGLGLQASGAEGLLRCAARQAHLPGRLFVSAPNLAAFLFSASTSASWEHVL